MSHFLTLILLPAETPDPAEQAEQIMKTFWIIDLSECYDADNWSPEFTPLLPGMERYKCDAFVIGGNYSGDILGIEPHYVEHEGERYIDPRPEDNICRAGDVAPDASPFAVVTPDGTWYESTRETAETWDATARALLAQHHDCIAVAFDCHC